jgi:hypothetical protein
MELTKLGTVDPSVLQDVNFLTTQFLIFFTMCSSASFDPERHMLSLS